MSDPHPASDQTPRDAAEIEATRYRGEVVYLFAFDVAQDMRREPVRQLMGQAVTIFAPDLSRRAPRQAFFYRPQMVHLPPVERFGPFGPVQMTRTVKWFSVGALSVSVRVPFQELSLENLLCFHRLDPGGGDLHQEVVALVRAICAEIGHYLIKPVAELAEDEAYTVFCLEAPLRSANGRVVSTGAWWHTQRDAVAHLLADERGPRRLARQEILESTKRNLSYYQHDLVVVDWDAALLIDEPRSFPETVYVMELANLQLAELEAYDRLLDVALDRAYRDLELSPWRSRGKTLKAMREIKIDLARVTDEISNITKFLGDWHLARTYRLLYARFHLGDWQRTVEQKIKMLSDFYQLQQDVQNNRMMLVLEFTIVLLFIVDLVLLAVGLD
ncbi:MAG: hypothetical protein ACREWG_06265 [Gammaproteobacteria bacterium]